MTRTHIRTVRTFQSSMNAFGGITQLSAEKLISFILSHERFSQLLTGATLVRSPMFATKVTVEHVGQLQQSRPQNRRILFPPLTFIRCPNLKSSCAMTVVRCVVVVGPRTPLSGSWIMVACLCMTVSSTMEVPSWH